MAEIAEQVHEMAFEAFGVRVAIISDDRSVLARLDSLAPVPSQPCDPAGVDHRISIARNRHGLYNVKFELREGEPIPERDFTSWMAGDADLDLAIASLDAHVQSLIALHAPEHTFVRAAVVSFEGRAIVLPGGPVTGKTVLARELVRAGATLYSEEFAVLDAHGLVHPYFRTSLPGAAEPGHRNGHRDERVAGSELAELQPLPVHAVVLTTYLPSAEWKPQRLSHGEAILALISYAEAGSERPQETFQGVTRAMASRPVVLRSERGEAATVAPLLIRDVQRAFAEAA